jgi:hypothetical protein
MYLKHIGAAQMLCTTNVNAVAFGQPGLKFSLNHTKTWYLWN